MLHRRGDGGDSPEQGPECFLPWVQCGLFAGLTRGTSVAHPSPCCSASCPPSQGRMPHGKARAAGGLSFWQRLAFGL